MERRREVRRRVLLRCAGALCSGISAVGGGVFDLRMLYYFRERLSRHMQERGINLLEQAFVQVTDGQITADPLKTCPFLHKCPAQRGERDLRFHLRFSQEQANVSRRRRSLTRQKNDVTYKLQLKLPCARSNTPFQPVSYP